MIYQLKTLAIPLSRAQSVSVNHRKPRPTRTRTNSQNESISTVSISSDSLDAQSGSPSMYRTTAHLKPINQQQKADVQRMAQLLTPMNHAKSMGDINQLPSTVNHADAGRFYRSKLYSSCFMNEISELEKYLAQASNNKDASTKVQKESNTEDRGLFRTAVFKIETPKKAVNTSLRTIKPGQQLQRRSSQRKSFYQYSLAPNSNVLDLTLPELQAIENMENSKNTDNNRKNSENLNNTTKPTESSTPSKRRHHAASKRRNTISSVALNKLSNSLALNNTEDLTANNKRLLSLSLASLRPAQTSNHQINQSNTNSNEAAALLSSIADADLERLKACLALNRDTVNNVDGRELTALDMALMLNHVPIVRILLNNGALENPRFRTAEDRYRRICEVLDGLDTSLRNMLGSLNVSLLSAPQIRDYDTQLKELDAKMKLYERMKTNFEMVEKPAAPSQCQLSVAGIDSLLVCFKEPTQSSGAYIAKYLIEWSTDCTFSTFSGQSALADSGQPVKSLLISGLVTGQIYHVRISCANIRGYSSYASTTPSCLAPSFWRSGPPCIDKQRQQTSRLQELNTQVAQSTDFLTPNDVSGLQRVRPKKASLDLKKNLKSLFSLALQPNASSNTLAYSSRNNSSNCKFTKQIKKGGLYLAMVLYDTDRVLSTNDDSLPLIEIDDTCSPAAINLDLQFLIKLSFNWPQTEQFKLLVENTINASSLRVKYKLLAAVRHMQTLLETDELGNVYHQALTHPPSGSVFFVLTKSVKSSQFRDYGLKPLGLVQLVRKNNVAKQAELTFLLQSTQNLIDHDRKRHVQLPRGLYVGFLQAQASIDVLKVQVSGQTPNALPCCQLRDNPHVSKEELSILKSLDDQVTNDFLIGVMRGVRALCQQVGINEEAEIDKLRLVTSELIELSNEVTMLLVSPSADYVCRMGSTPEANRVYLPVAIFEANCLGAHHSEFIREYVKASIKLEIEHLASSQYQREAFSQEEITNSKRFVTNVNKFQKLLEEIWRSQRWLINHLSALRDKDRPAISSTIHQLKNCLNRTVLKNSDTRNSNIYNQITTLDNNTGTIAFAQLHKPDKNVYNLATRLATPNHLINLQTANCKLDDSHLKPSPPSLPLDHLLHNRSSLSRKISVFVDPKLIPVEIYFEVNIANSGVKLIGELVQLLLIRLNEFIGRLNRSRAMIALDDLLRESKDNFVHIKVLPGGQLKANTTSCHILYKCVDTAGHVYVLNGIGQDGGEVLIEENVCVSSLLVAGSTGKFFLREKLF